MTRKKPSKWTTAITGAAISGCTMTDSLQQSPVDLAPSSAPPSKKYQLDPEPLKKIPVPDNKPPTTEEEPDNSRPSQWPKKLRARYADAKGGDERGSGGRGIS